LKPSPHSATVARWENQAWLSRQTRALALKVKRPLSYRE